MSNASSSPELRVYRRHRNARGEWQVSRCFVAPVLLKTRVCEVLPYVGTYSLRILVEAGFVKGERRSGVEYRVDVQSFLTHLAASRAPGFWNADRTRAYHETRLRLYPRD